MLRSLLTTDSSSQHDAHVQDAAWGVRIPSSIRQNNVLPPYRILLFQSLLLPRPHKFSNSEGVYQLPSYLMHLPLPPDTWKMNKQEKMIKRCGILNQEKNEQIVSFQGWIFFQTKFVPNFFAQLFFLYIFLILILFLSPQNLPKWKVFFPDIYHKKWKNIHPCPAPFQIVRYLGSYKRNS